MKEIKKKLVAATEDGVDKAKIQEEITQLKDQLTSIAEAASFSGGTGCRRTSAAAPSPRASSGDSSVTRAAPYL